MRQMQSIRLLEITFLLLQILVAAKTVWSAHLAVEDRSVTQNECFPGKAGWHNANMLPQQRPLILFHGRVVVVLDSLGLLVGLLVGLFLGEILL